MQYILQTNILNFSVYGKFKFDSHVKKKKKFVYYFLFSYHHSTIVCLFQKDTSMERKKKKKGNLTKKELCSLQSLQLLSALAARSNKVESNI